MIQEIGIKRLYFIANYQNVSIDSKVTNIPVTVLQNPNAVNNIYYAQLLAADLAYKRYMNLRQKMADNKVTDVVEFLENELEAVRKELEEQINITTEVKEGE